MTEDEVRAQDLTQETSSTLSGNEQFVMFDTTEGKRADIDDVATYIAGNKANLQTTDKSSVVAAVNENHNAIGDVKEDLGGMTRNLFNFQNVTSYSNFERSGNTIINSKTDSKTYFRMQVSILDATMTNIVTSNYIDATEPKRLTRTLTPTSAGKYVRVKHNGSTRDLQFVFQCDTEANKPYTFSTYVTSVNPSVVGGLVLSEIQFEQNSQATSYIPNITATDYVAREEIVATNNRVVTLESSLNGSRYLDVVNGGISGGKPDTSTGYIRSADFIRIHIGDVLTISPSAFSIYYAYIYKYNVDNYSGYYDSVQIPTISSGSTWQYTFQEECWIKFKASNASSGALITPQDLYYFNNVFYLTHLYDADELLHDEEGLSLDYDTINSTINGNFNIALQTDTHMEKYVGYTTAQYAPSDFGALKAVVNSINLLNIDLFANLGDFIRGYQCDPDYESRESADEMLSCYREIRTNKAFVIGNHDDGCLFYSNSTYNDNPSSQQVMFPNEQFNRYVKFGINNKGVSNYYFSDINGVRIITLYQRDFNYADAIPEVEAFKISADQISWLTNTALDTALPVIVLTHAPLESSLYNVSRTGFDDVLSALYSFMNNGGTVIAVLSGHTHSQNTAKVNGINHIVLKNGYDLFELVSVNQNNRTITCKAMNGSSPDLSLTY